ncbi:MAG TPA: hypothetical protein ENG63_06930 [Candidatus Desulfofervidus auxilii]|uniref:Uncharacterized protein n=1 Tax=Desulfofervidus auxilii TaxID=1621989 RepID=A0A7C0U320_DESA2|nr:hypothetical protein [Candidatus Desulfofervidus auxilii]
MFQVSNRWLPPKEFQTDAAFIYLTEPHILPYVTIEEIGDISGIWDSIKKLGSDVWAWTKRNKWLVIPMAAGGIALATSKKLRKHPGWILGPMGAYALGYAIYKYRKKPAETVKQGATDTEAKLTALQYGFEYDPDTKSIKFDSKVAAWDEQMRAFIDKETGKTVTPAKGKIEIKDKAKALKKAEEVAKKTKFWEDFVLQVGAPLAALFIQSKVSDKAYEQALSYATAHPELAQYYSSPEEAANAILYQNAGLPPNPDDPWGKYVRRPGLAGMIEAYKWPIIIGVGLVGVAALLRRK